MLKRGRYCRPALRLVVRAIEGTLDIGLETSVADIGLLCAAVFASGPVAALTIRFLQYRHFIEFSPPDG